MSMLYVRGSDGKFIPVPSVKGKDGHTPQKGVDYYTQEEKDALVEEIQQKVTGNIETALDNIIAIQESLIGGAIE